MAGKQAAEKPDALKKLKADLRAGVVGTFYVFYGEEAYLREHYRKLLEKKLLDGPAADFNFHRFNAETLTPQLLSEAVEAVPMMAERTLIQVEDVDFFKLPENQREQYRVILEELPDWCCVLLLYNTVEFKLNRTMKKLADVFQKKAELVEFRRQSEADLKSWILSHFQAYGKTISDDLCRKLMFLTDSSMSLLSAEIEKLAHYAGGTEIRQSDLDAVVVPVLTAQTFSISDKLADGEYEAALRILQELFAMQTEPLLILGAIGSQMRRMLYARLVMAEGKGQQTLCDLTGMKSYPAGLTMTAARKVSDRFCVRAAELCLETDEKMKRTGNDQKQLLELLLMNLSLEARRGKV